MQTFIFSLCAISGWFFHSCMKLNSLQKQAKAGNVEFSIKRYIQDDIFSLLASFSSIFIWLLLFKETANKFPQIVEYARLSFVLMGASGSYLIQYFLSNAEKRITKVIDEKTNIADGKITK